MTDYRQLDPIDQCIVDFLREDGRTPYRKIARELGVSESMVRKRVNKLLETGYMRIMAISDALQLGVPVLATTYATVSPQYLESVTDRLAKSVAVRYLAIGVGRNNLVLESIHANNAELYEFIQHELGLEGIISSETMQVVKIKKSIWDWDLSRLFSKPTAPRKKSKGTE